MGCVYRKRKQGRDLGWYAAYVDGHGRRRHVATKQPSKQAARVFLAEIEARVRRGLIGVPEVRTTRPLTVAELFERWLAEGIGPRIKDPQASRRQGTTCMRRLLPMLGKVVLPELTRGRMARARDELARRGFAPNTVRTTMQVVSSIVSWGVRADLLTENPLKGVQLPRRESAAEWLDQREAAALLLEAERRARTGGPRDGVRHVAIGLALLCGLRRGEIFGLRWRDIDLARERLTVARSYGGTPKSGEPRHLRLPPDLVPILRAWLPRCPKTPQGLVCPVRYDGAWRMSSQRVAHGLPQLLAAAGCKSLRRGWHALRHTFASLFVQAGGSLYTLARLLGHSDVSTTAIYAHLSEDFLGDEMARIRLRG